MQRYLKNRQKKCFLVSVSIFKPVSERIMSKTSTSMNVFYVIKVLPARKDTLFIVKLDKVEWICKCAWCVWRNVHKSLAMQSLWRRHIGVHEIKNMAIGKNYINKSEESSIVIQRQFVGFFWLVKCHAATFKSELQLQRKS